MLHRKKENNTIFSSINWISNLVNNVFASVHYLRFQYKVTVLFHLKLTEFPCQKVVNTAGGIFFTGWCEPEEE